MGSIQGAALRVLAAAALLGGGASPAVAGSFMGLGGTCRRRIRERSQRMSADGSVVVGRGASASGIEAFRWTASGGMVGLGHLPANPRA